MGGNPVFSGTRVPLHMLAELVPSPSGNACARTRYRRGSGAEGSWLSRCIPLVRSMLRRKRKKPLAGPGAFRRCATSRRILTKVLPELAPPTGKGCRCLVASGRLAARCSAVSPCDSALPPHNSSGSASEIRPIKLPIAGLAAMLIHVGFPPAHPGLGPKNREPAAHPPVSNGHCARRGRQS
jgi:hypothetical protein